MQAEAGMRWRGWILIFTWKGVCNYELFDVVDVVLSFTKKHSFVVYTR